MKAYKLLRRRKNGTLGPLFINRKQIIPIGEWLQAGEYRTKGFAFRPGWHTAEAPEAPHLKMEGRVWMEVEVEDYYHFDRPKHQGGRWLIAKQMKVIGPVEEEDPNIECPDCGRFHYTYYQAERCTCNKKIG